jgi:integrase/recombinase XerD
MTKVYLDLDEIQLLERSATNLRDLLLIRLLFHLGCRVSEALGIRVEDIDFKQGTVTIEHLKARISLSCPECGTRLGKIHKFCPVCGLKVEKAVAREKEHRRYRSLPVDEGTLAMLKEYIERGGAREKDGKRLIFDMTRHRAWQIIKDCANKAGLPKLLNPESGIRHNISPHKLRDAFAVNAVRHHDSGDGLRLLQEHLGHASFNTTAKYRKVAGEELKDWYNSLWEDGAKSNGAKTG